MSCATMNAGFGSVLVCCVLLGGVAAAQTAPAPAVNADAKAMADFKTRIDGYVELHRRAEKGAPPMQQTSDPARLQAAQAALAKQIQQARRGAKQGDIFTPDIRRVFRRLMYPETKGPEGRQVNETIRDDAPRGVPLRVNATYPEDAPLPTVPPNLLAALPRLPEELEYRFIDRHLILRDVHADIIVDYIPNALR